MRTRAQVARIGRAQAGLRICIGATIVAVLVLVGSTAPAVGARPGGWTQAQVNAAVDRGVAYLPSQQNADGSFGTAFPDAETALALAAYDVADQGDVTNLSAKLRASLLSGLRFLLKQQIATGQVSTDYPTYTTGLTLTALGLMGPVPGETSAIQRAISRGRRFLISEQQAPRSVTGSSTAPSCQTTGALGSGLGGQDYCGGWNYDTGTGRSDESNTGFALTGLELSGGVPSATAQINIGWQRNNQELSSNSFATRHDGGGDYQPGATGATSSNANDTGSLVFGYAYDGVPPSDPGVKAAIAFGHDVLQEYERVKKTIPRVMVYHTGQRLDGTCAIGPASCDWSFGSGEGGYHYSLFALSKGLSQYETPSLSDPSNYYAEIVDLLLSDQAKDGSWPADLRDDASPVAATSFAILALGRVGAPPPPMLGKAVNLGLVSGSVLVKRPGQASFQRLTGAEQIPVGSTVDATNGKVLLTAAANTHGKTQSADFYSGGFRVSQQRGKALTTLRLVGGGSSACPHAAGDSPGPVAITAARHPRRSLWGSGKGSYTTQGTSASATVRGTVWLTEDFCEGTLVHVKRGTVVVRDFVRRKTIIVHAPGSYFAAVKR